MTETVAAPGARNLLTDVPGLKVGNAQDKAILTGATVIVPDTRATCGVSVMGGGPGTRETDALAAGTLVDQVDAVVLSGGSVYGLASADGVAAVMGAEGLGFGLVERPGVPKSPVIPAAILYDLANSGDKGWGETPPYRELGAAAYRARDDAFALGAAGAGCGALAGQVRGGLGSASIVTADGHAVGALVAVNSFGSVRVPGHEAFWAAPYELNGEFGGLGMPGGVTVAPEDWGAAKINPGPRENTTIALVATDAPLTPSDARRLATMAMAGFARAIRPVFTPFDGDVVFALSTADPARGGVDPLTLARLGELAAGTLARAIGRGVYEAGRGAGV